MAKPLTRDDRSAILKTLAEEMKEDLLEDEREDEEDGYSSDEDFVAEDDPEEKSIRKLRLAEFRKNIQAKDEKMITSYL